MKDVVTDITVGAGVFAGGILYGGGLGATLGGTPLVGPAAAYQYAMRICLSWVCKRPSPAKCKCIAEGWIADTWECDCGLNGVIMSDPNAGYGSFPGNNSGTAKDWQSRW